MRNVRRFSPRQPLRSFRRTSAPGRFPTSRRCSLSPVLGGVEGTLPEVPSEEERLEKAAEVSGRFGTGAGVCRHVPHSFPVLPSSLLVELAEIPDSCVCLGSVLNCIESMCATPIMRVDLCAASQLLLFLTTKRDIPEEP